MSLWDQPPSPAYSARLPDSRSRALACCLSGSGFKLLGKAGAFFWWGETNGCGDFLCNSFQGTTLGKSNSVSFTWGAALRWDFTRSLGVRIDYDTFGEIYNAKMQTISIGLYALFF